MDGLKAWNLMLVLEKSWASPLWAPTVLTYASGEVPFWLKPPPLWNVDRLVASIAAIILLVLLLLRKVICFFEVSIMATSDAAIFLAEGEARGESKAFI